MKRSVLFAMAVVFTILGFQLGLHPTGAQDQMIDFTIGKFTCPTDPGSVSLAAGNIPDECDPTAGVSFTVAMDDGTEIGSCTTDDSGFEPRENPISTQAVTEFAGALFINLPVTQPPVVGVGTTAERPGGSDSNLELTMLLSLALAVMGIVWRKRVVR
jgi:hypothetical protein